MFLQIVGFVHDTTSLTADPNNGDVRIVNEDGNVRGVFYAYIYTALAVGIHIMLRRYVKIFLNSRRGYSHQGTAQDFAVLSDAKGDFANGLTSGNCDIAGEGHQISAGWKQRDECAARSVPFSAACAADGGGVIYHRLTDINGLYSGVDKFDHFIFLSYRGDLCRPRNNG
jgi:hypothetical protein